MKKFNYTMNHKADEAYMAQMCREGWGATRLVEGVWTFEPCRPNQYVYRVCYLRGKSAAEVEQLKRRLSAEGVEFVSRYSLWEIGRSVAVRNDPPSHARRRAGQLDSVFRGSSADG